MDQLVVDACQQLEIDSSRVIETSIRVTDSEVVFLVDLGIKGTPKLRFNRTGQTVVYIGDLNAMKFTKFASLMVPPLAETVEIPTPSTTKNVDFAKTQQPTPQKRAWQARRKAVEEKKVEI